MVLAPITQWPTCTIEEVTTPAEQSKKLLQALNIELPLAIPKSDVCVATKKNCRRGERPNKCRGLKAESPLLFMGNSHYNAEVAVYPEYISDPNIYVCPSSAKHTPEDLYYDDGTPVLGFLGQHGDTTYNDWWKASWSYMYFGFVYDRCDSRPEFLVDLDPALEGILSVVAPEVPIPANAQAPAQFQAHWLKIMLENNLGVMPYNWRGPYPPFEEDTSGLDPYGNGGGDVVYRLREGIERFLITDINNPAASAQAQSTISIMWDIVSTKVDVFNHVPGGSNVLYMDGHVEFLRYPNVKAPITPEIALASSIF